MAGAGASWYAARGWEAGEPGAWSSMSCKLAVQPANLMQTVRMWVGAGTRVLEWPHQAFTV